jgi:hypothetical protein
MGTEQEKSVIELSVFDEFIQKSGLPITPASIKKNFGQSEPDITCELLGDGLVAFELVEICDSELAEKLVFVQSGGEFSPNSFNNPSHKIICKKLGKSYRTNLPIELLCYTNGRVAPPDDVLLAEIRSACDKSSGQFRRIWLLGEKGNLYKV